MADKRSNRGVALYLVLAVMAVTIVLANVVMRLMVSQAQMTWHQTSRVRAQYAAMAGVNYALEMLRLEADPGFAGVKTWTPAGAPTYHDLCQIDMNWWCRGPGYINPNNMDSSLREINITVEPRNALANPTAPDSYPIKVKVNYTMDQG